MGARSRRLHRAVVDLWLPTVSTARGRALAGLSAGGYGAADIGMRHPELFGAVESWSGYFRPLHDGPFKHADASELAANDPTRLAGDDRSTLARAGTRFFISSGPAHSHWFRPGESVAFAHELTRLRLPVTLRLFADRRGEWRAQFDAGLAWAFPAPPLPSLRTERRVPRSRRPAGLGHETNSCDRLTDLTFD